MINLFALFSSARPTNRCFDVRQASVLSRITTVLPFVPFSMEEKRAICSEAFYTLGGEFARTLPQERVEGVIESALASFIPAEGARSLSRAISNQLVDII